MNPETLALIAQATEDTPADLGEHETETPEQLIGRGIIPDGYTRDTKTREVRPKKARGRPRNGDIPVPPVPDGPITRTADVAPDGKARAGKVRPPVPPWRKGVIAAGMSRLYKRAGRIVRAMDRDIGTAIMEAADDCGEAWDELARTNPRVRGVLMKMIAGGAWTSVLMAHLPILLAIMMKENIRRRIPLANMAVNFFNDDDTEGQEEAGEGDLFDLLGSLSPEDMQEAMRMAMGTMTRVVPGTVVRGD